MATAMEIDLRKAAIRAEGDLDVRSLLGMSEEVPVGLQISGFILRWSLTRRQSSYPCLSA
jgi:hypothetical protein